MELQNETPFEAELIHGPDGPHRHGAVVLVKMTRALSPSGLSLSPPEFIWPVNRQDFKTDYGTFPFDHHFPLSKLDLMVCGDACAPHGRAVRQMEVMLQVGHFSYRQLVFGNRLWTRSMFGYKASDPEPFATMPLTLGRAFGGTAHLENGDFPCLENPEGKGYLLKEIPPDNVALPNIERPDHLMRQPYDQPRPTCMTPYPLAGKLRYDELVEDGGIREFDGADSSLYFGQAHPDLMIDRPGPGTAVHLSGMTPQQPIQFEIPPVPFESFLVIDDTRLPMRTSMDGICIFAHQNCVGFKFRAVATFVLEPRQTRRVVVKERVS